MTQLGRVQAASELALLARGPPEGTHGPTNLAGQRIRRERDPRAAANDGKPAEPAVRRQADEPACRARRAVDD